METSNALQNATVQTPATFNFKSAALNVYSRQIAAIGQDMALKNVELAKILGKIKMEKCYEQDGFKSVSDYAEQTFSIKKSQAYQLANVGARFYNNDSETAQRVVSLLSPANMAEIAGMDDTAIAAAIESGEISKDSTQKQLRETAKAGKPASKTTVEKIHNISAKIVHADGTLSPAFMARVTIPAFETQVFSGDEFEGAISKKFSGDSKMGLILYSFDSGAFARVEYMEASPAEVKPKTKTKFTVEELMAMLEAAKAEQEEESGE